jgi:hypothetical protein
VSSWGPREREGGRRGTEKRGRRTKTYLEEEEREFVLVDGTIAVCVPVCMWKEEEKGAGEGGRKGGREGGEAFVNKDAESRQADTRTNFLSPT